jgi:hypothetical protein
MTTEGQTKDPVIGIPVDIIATADGVAKEVYAKTIGSDDDSHYMEAYEASDIIGNAIFAERERCALIVESFASGRGVNGNPVKARRVPSQTSILLAQLIRGEA